MKFFRSFIRVKHKDEPNELILRKSKYILFGLVIGYFLVILLTASLIFFSLNTADTAGGWTLLSDIAGIGVLAFIVFLNIIGTKLLINYYYDVVIITSDNVCRITYKLFFTEKVHIIELYRIQTLSATQNGLLPIALNYGTIEMMVQNVGKMKIRYIPKPKLVVQKLEELKEHATNMRFLETEGE